VVWDSGGVVCCAFVAMNDRNESLLRNAGEYEAKAEIAKAVRQYF